MNGYSKGKRLPTKRVTDLNSSEINIGTYGWCHPDWSGTFYDPDLPADWRLSWYANHFRTVVIPADYVLSADRIDRWLADTDPAFRFILEIDQTFLSADPAQPDEWSLKTIERLFSGQLDAVIYRSGRIDRSCKSPKWMCLPELEKASFCIGQNDVSKNDPKGWDFRYERRDAGELGLDYVVYSSSGNLSQMRIILESMREESDKRQALIFTDQQAGGTHAQQARILSDLLSAQ